MLRLQHKSPQKDLTNESPTSQPQEKEARNARGFTAARSVRVVSTRKARAILLIAVLSGLPEFSTLKSIHMPERIGSLLRKGFSRAPLSPTLDPHIQRLSLYARIYIVSNWSRAAYFKHWNPVHINSILSFDMWQLAVLSQGRKDDIIRDKDNTSQ